MAFSNSTRFLVRTDGSDTANGGNFVTTASGTDYSNQAAPQYSLTGGTSAGAGSVILHASAAADMVGNGLVVTAGTNATTGFYQVVSVSVGVSVTVDRAVTTGVGAAIAFAIGGAFLTISKAHSLAVANNKISFKNGTYTVTAALTVTLDSTGAPGMPLTFEGFNATPGDNGSPPTWTTSTNSVNLVEFTAARNVQFVNIFMSSTAGTRGDGLHAKTTGNSFQVGVTACKMTGFNRAIYGDFNVDWSFLGLYVTNTRITGCVSHAIRNSGGGLIHGCTLDANGGDGLSWSTGTPWISTAWTLSFTIIYNNTANGINVVGSNVGGTSLPHVNVINCSISTNGGAGLLATNNNQPTLQIVNTIFDANGTYGIDCSSGGTQVNSLLQTNAFYNNTTAATRNINAGIGTITLSASPYTSVGTDFSLNSNAGGGTLCKNAAFPGAFILGGTGSLSLGAVQPSGATTTTLVINQNITRFVNQADLY